MNSKSARNYDVCACFIELTHKNVYQNLHTIDKESAFFYTQKRSTNTKSAKNYDECACFIEFTHTKKHTNIITCNCCEQQVGYYLNINY